MSLLRKALLAACFAGGAFCAFGGTMTCSFGWYRNAAQADFQVPVALEEGVNGFTYADAAANGADLCVTDAGGTQLPIEIENWNPSGKSIVWVKVPSFSKDTVLTFLWGADAAGLTPLRDNLWGSDARLVMHLADGKDSSTYNAAFVRNGDDATEDGPVGMANTFGTEARKYNCASMQNGQVANLGNNFTISFWLNSANLGKTASGGVVEEYLFVGMVPSGQFAVLHGYKAGYLELFFYGCVETGTNPRNASALPILGDGWHHYAWTYDGTTLKSYCDGKIVASRDISFTLKTSTNSHVFRLGGAGSSAYLHGSLDELRIESVARPTAWLAAACETQGQTLPLESVVLDLPELSVEETLTNFTALVAINNAHAAWSTAFYNAAQDGKLVFRTSPGGPDCEYEAERVPFANDLPMSWWVKLPEWRAGQKLYAYWPRYAVNASHAYVNTNAWDQSYLHVFHFTPLVERRDSIGYVTRLNGYENGAVNPMLGPYTSHYNSTADGPTGQSLAMLTTSNVFTRVNFRVLPPPLTNRFTVAFWARRDDFSAPKLAYMLVYLPERGDQTAVITDYGNNAFRLYTAGYTPNGMLLPIPDAGWHHYAFTCDGSQAKGYRDGELVVTSSSVFNFKLPTSGGLNAWVGGARSNNNGFVGAIDEFRVAYEPRSPEWIRACYRNQYAFRHATERLHPPAFAREVSATAGADSLTFNADLVCRLPSDVTLCWGPSDGGTTLSAWANTRSLGSCDEGALAEAVAELAADQRVCARYFATNAYGKAWSRPIWGRTPFATSAYYATVRFRGYEGRSALTNFPACVRLPASTKLPASADGVRFSAADGTPLPFEVETWNPSGESVVWVRVPVLTAATELTIAWQGLDATGDLSAGGTVWGDEYMRVYHFASTNESSIYQANAPSFANYSAAESPAGPGLAFNNQTALRLDAKRFYDFAGGLTLQLWAKLADGNQSYVASAVGSQQLAFIYGLNSADRGVMELYAYNPRPNHGGDVLRNYARLRRPDDGWHHYAYTYDGRRFASYLDGVQVTNLEFRATFGVDPRDNRETTEHVSFGAAPSGNNKVVDGALDEYRAEKVGRSADWIRACWQNQATRTFCTVGPVCGRGLAIIIR